MEMLTRGFSEQAADSQTSLVPAMAMPTVVVLFTAGVFPQILEKVNPSSGESNRKLIIAVSDKQSRHQTFQWGSWQGQFKHQENSARGDSVSGH